MKRKKVHNIYSNNTVKYNIFPILKSCECQIPCNCNKLIKMYDFVVCKRYNYQSSQYCTICAKRSCPDPINNFIKGKSKNKGKGRNKHFKWKYYDDLFF